MCGKYYAGAQVILHDMYEHTCMCTQAHLCLRGIFSDVLFCGLETTVDVPSQKGLRSKTEDNVNLLRLNKVIYAEKAFQVPKINTHFNKFYGNIYDRMYIYDDICDGTMR